MNYELVKELKDAGFPQGDSMMAWVSQEEGLHMGRESENDIYVPTLSELIEACGDKFNTLNKVTGISGKTLHWRAGEYDFDDCHWPRLCLEGSTPEEAVANLYIVLNKK